MNGAGRPRTYRVFDGWICRELIGGAAAPPEEHERVLGLVEASEVESRPYLENRAFTVRAVTYLARNAGVDQFLDIGAGPPAWGSAHETARRYRPGAAVAYVDADPRVVAAWQEVVAGQGPMCAVEGDVTEPAGILADPRVLEVIDFARPVGLLLTAVLNLVSAEYDHAAIVRTLMGASAPGSHLVLTHMCGDGQSPERLARVREFAQSTGGDVTIFTRAQIVELFAGLELVEPGVVRAVDWRPVHVPSRPTGWFVGGVARKP